MIVVALSFSFTDFVLYKCLDLNLKIPEINPKRTVDLSVSNVTGSLIKRLLFLVNKLPNADWLFNQ